MKQIFSLYLFGFFVQLSCTICPANDRHATNWIGFDSEDRSSVYREVEELIGARNDIIHTMIRRLSDESSTINQIEGAARILGHYRAVEAIPVLLSKLTIELRERRNIGMMSTEMFSPISFALINIGRPSTPAVFDMMLRTADSGILDLCLLICIEIEGLDEISRLVDRQIADPSKISSIDRLMLIKEHLPSHKSELKAITLPKVTNN